MISVYISDLPDEPSQENESKQNKAVFLNFVDVLSLLEICMNKLDEYQQYVERNS